MILGAHESIAGGLHRAFERAREDRADAIQIFTKNGSQWKEPEIAGDAIDTFRRAHRDAGEGALFCHVSYLVNLASDDPVILERSRQALAREVRRSDALGVRYVVFHPGAHRGLGEDRGLTRIAESIDWVHAETKGARCHLTLENTAGQGTCLGSQLSELAAIVERTRTDAHRLRVCLDTQHLFAAGYDLRTERGYEGFFSDFDREVGRDRLVGFHLNGSKKPLGSRVDRHDDVGAGEMGLYPFWRLVNDERVEHTPGILETPPGPGEKTSFARNLVTLRALVGRSTCPRSVSEALRKPRKKAASPPLTRCIAR
jgi:deoxyribonuclease IV